MAFWAPQYPIDFSPTGDTTSQAIEKFMNENNRIYDLLNRVRKFDYGTVAPSDPIEGHLWLDMSGTVPVFRYWNGSTWKEAGVWLANGQLNLPFNQTPILVNGQDLMNRTFYVDAVNGDDNNPGTEEAPFKTLKKAIDSVPVGGEATILLKDNQIYTIDSQISIEHKNIIIRSEIPYLNSGDFGNDSRPIIQPTEWLDTSNGRRGLFTFKLYLGASLCLEGVHIHIPPSENDSLSKMVYSCSFIVFSVDYYYIRFTRGTLKNESDYRFIESWGGYTGSLRFSTFETKFIVNDSWHSQIRLERCGTAILDIQDYSCSIEDSNGNSLSWSDIIDGIIRDANGTPRNIISNIVF